MLPEVYMIDNGPSVRQFDFELKVRLVFNFNNLLSDSKLSPLAFEKIV
jgi:hypothetical protein